MEKDYYEVLLLRVLTEVLVALLKATGKFNLKFGSAEHSVVVVLQVSPEPQSNLQRGFCTL
jgi:hypothetical protein